MKIELTNICKSFNNTKSNTIDNFNLIINDGEFVALLGPSGCGKSTTMLMIAGIYKPNGGEIYFDGQLVNEIEPKDRNIGMVFQSYALYPHMTVLDNIAFPLKQQKVAKVEREQRAKEAAEMVHLGHLLDRKPSQLSGGQQQRVALARAIVKKPRVLLLDEPLSNLDARLKIEMREEISRIQKELGITTILVTHDQEEAMTMADRIAVMKDGRLIQYSTPMELYSQPKNYFVAQFVGTPPMNFLPGEIIGIPNVNVGIRPHDLRLGAKGDIRLDGVVSLVEPIGHSLLVNVRINDTQIRFFAEPNMKLARGYKVELNTNKESIHLFELQTGERQIKRKGNQGRGPELVLS